MRPYGNTYKTIICSQVHVGEIYISFSIDTNIVKERYTFPKHFFKVREERENGMFIVDVEEWYLKKFKIQHLVASSA